VALLSVEANAIVTKYNKCCGTKRWKEVKEKKGVFEGSFFRAEMKGRKRLLSGLVCA